LNFYKQKISEDITAKKSLGQHFLHDENICQQIVDAALQSDTLAKGSKNLLEIGPGAGAITKYLVTHTGINFKCVELDTEKINYLPKQYPSLEGNIIHADFLKIEPPFEGQFDVVGNFPYNISTQIIFKILDWQHLVPQVVGMFQKEVAVRFASKHGSKNYGITSVVTQCYYDVALIIQVPPTSFTPPPKVDSAVIILRRNNNPHKIEDYKRFKTFIKTAFSQRRKTLRNCFKGFLKPETLQAEIFNMRAEQLSVAKFAELYHNTLND
jgi:16S rRNA (adenine1518-N6/adenine1519-N6)-dimethyltransferase